MSVAPPRRLLLPRGSRREPALAATGTDGVVGILPGQAIRGVLDCPPDELPQVAPRDSPPDVAMDSGIASLRCAPRLGNPNHTEAGRALPSIWTLFRCQGAHEIGRYP